MKLHTIKVMWVILIVSHLGGLAGATPENANISGKDCLFCHPNGPPALGPAGIYFAENGNLEGFEETEAATDGTTGEVEAGLDSEVGIEEFHEDIGVHIDQWNVAIICFISLLLVIGVVYASGI